jgi:uncharacterized damage-inducible protein DinB
LTPERWQIVKSVLQNALELPSEARDAFLQRQVHFFRGPKTLGEFTRLEFAWFLLMDEIHHRGQFSIYSRIADAKVPSIYGPSADEPWT